MQSRFLYTHRFALGMAGAWLATVWGLVFVGQAVSGQPFSLVAWAGSWDGGWYQSIVDHGYYAGIPMQQENVAFFPLYPSLVWLASKVTQLPTVWAGMALSSLSFAAALVVLYYFVSQRWNRGVARWTLFLFAFNPFSFYFGMMYTEALFLLLAAATLWYAFTKQWWLAALMAGLGTATRSVGVALGIYVVIAWVWHGHIKRRYRGASAASLRAENPRYLPPRFVRLRQICQLAILVLLSFSGIILFSLYLWQHTGDPLVYSHTQAFWPGRGISNIATELIYLFTAKTINLEYAITAMWYAATLVAFAGAALLIKMREYLLALYSGIALSLPLLFGTATSMNRYMLVAVPIFIAYAAVIATRPRWVRLAVATLCVIGLVAAIFLIVNPRGAFVG